MWKLCGFFGIVRFPRSWLVMCVSEAQDGGVVGVGWPSSPASSLLRILNEHFQL